VYFATGNSRQRGEVAVRRIALLLLSLAAAGCGTTDPGSAGAADTSWPTESVQPGDVVPWAPLAATHPRIPTVTIPAVPDPSEAAEAPECRASQLRAEPEFDGAGGTTYLNVRLVLAAGQPCRLQGFPDLQPMDDGHPAEIPIRQLDDDSIYRDPVLVADGQPAMLSIGWANWCSAPVDNDTIRANLPGEAGALTFAGFGSSPFCNGTPGSGPSPIYLAPLQPEDLRPAETRSIYGSLEVAGDLDLTSSPGEQVRFIITITSRRDLVLDPCPDYTIAQYGDGVSQEQRFALNCAAVPYQDPEGRPYLPADAPVRFAMTTTAALQDASKFNWELDVPEHTIGVGGQLTVD
jgi:hypothetical protein